MTAPSVLLRIAQRAVLICRAPTIHCELGLRRMTPAVEPVAVPWSALSSSWFFCRWSPPPATTTCSKSVGSHRCGRSRRRFRLSLSRSYERITSQ